MLPKIVKLYGFECELCHYDPALVELNQLFHPKTSQFEAQSVYMIVNYKNEMFSKIAPGIAYSDNGTQNNTEVEISHSYCNSCIEAALYYHYDLIFPPIDFESNNGHYRTALSFLGDVASNIQYYLQQIEIEEEKKRNVSLVLGNV